MSREQYSTLIAFSFILLAITFLLNFSPWLGISTSLNDIVTTLVGFAFMLAHGYMAWGLRNILAFVLITWILSFCSEAIGVATGLVFGQYYYTDHLGPKVLGVPLLIQISYATMGYVSLMTARLILGIKENNDKLSLLLSTVLGTLLMVAWDLCIDPYESTFSGDWIWPHGGPYFGVGIHNFVGWFITVFLFMFLYQLFAFHYREQLPPPSGRMFWSQPYIYYAIMAIDLVTVPLIGSVSGPLTSPKNYPGSLNDMVSSLSLIAFFVMGIPCFIALARLLMDKPSKVNSDLEKD